MQDNEEPRGPSYFDVVAAASGMATIGWGGVDV
jgi:hypothetical protein